ncbi:MAG: HDIG domain-containing metalloprotein [Pseudomonadota bacterium]
MKIPSQTECFNLIKQMNMMDHIIDHSIMVSNVSLCLCKALQKHFPDLNEHLVVAAALLHDITKTRSFETHEIHSETGGQMLTQMGYPEVGAIIRQHVLLDVYDMQSPVTVEEIVNYSDKRVLHDQVVSLEKRLEYIECRYASTDQLKKRLRLMCIKTLDLEKKLFGFLDIKPDQLRGQTLNCESNQKNKITWGDAPQQSIEQY